MTTFLHRAAFAAALLALPAAASALTIAEVEPDPTSASTSAASGISFTLDGTTLANFGGTATFATTDGGGFLRSLNAVLSGGSITGFGLATLAPIPSGGDLNGALEDASVDVAGGTVQALFGNGGGALSGAYGDFVLLTFTAAAPLSTDTSIPNSGGVSIEGVREIADTVIPLPAAGWLLLAGVGALVLRSRRGV